MSTPKHLPVWAHEEIKRINKTYGAKKPFKRKARLWDSVFKGLVKNGYGRPDIVDRAIDVLKDDLSSEEVTGKQIVSHIEAKRSAIMATISPSPKSERVPRMLAVFIMRKDAGLNRRSAAEEVGYSSLTAVNQAEQYIYAEMDSNRAFRKVVYEIKAELGY